MFTIINHNHLFKVSDLKYMSRNLQTKNSFIKLFKKSNHLI
jgi:hypothetical protein